jgi:hypothetical protein
VAEITGKTLSGALADLARVNVRYLLEWRQHGELKAAVSLPLPPRALSISTPAAPLITYTLGGEPLRELAPVKARIISLTGSTGYDVRAGYTRRGAIAAATGAEILREFRGFLELYQEAAAADPTTYTTNGGAPSNELIFRALDEDLHARVEPESLTIERDAMSSHTAPAWTATFTAYGEPEPYARPFERYQAALEGISAAIRTAGSVLAVAGLAVQGVNSLARLALGPLDSLRFITAGIESTLEGVASLADIPADAIDRLENAALSTRQSLTRLSADLERFPSRTGAAWEALSVAILGADEVQTQAARALALGGIVRRTPSPYLPPAIGAQEPTYESPQGARPVVAVRLSEGESLLDLARRIYGALDRWQEIADLNGWQSATRTASGRPARAGDVVLIEQPPAVDTGEGVAGPDIYRTDLKITAAGALELTPGGDLATISGPPNIEQALRLRTQTKQGEHAHAPRYGLPRAIGRRITATTSGQLAAIVREQITQDPRIERVSRFEVSDNGDALAFSLEAISADGALISPTLTL